MNIRLRSLLAVICMLFGADALAQTGRLSGRVTDEKNEGLPSAIVKLTSGGVDKGGTVTDFDGNYEFPNLQPGRYEVFFSYQGRQNQLTDVLVTPNEGYTLNTVIRSTQIKEVVVVAQAKRPLINPKSPGGIRNMTGEQFATLPTLNPTDAASLGPGVYQQTNGAGVSIAGGRFSGTKYIVDGVQMNPGDNSFTNLPASSIDLIQTMTSGLPARYGDASGGVISIVTKGVTPTVRGNVWLEHSIDGYNSNTGSFGLSGPLLWRKDSTGAKQPALGYRVDLSGVYSADGSPTYLKNYYLKDDVLQSLQQNPLFVDPSNPSGLSNRSEFLSADDFVQEKRRRNAEGGVGRALVKLDYSLNQNINITLGGSHEYSNGNGYDRGRSLFDPTGQSRSIGNATRGYLRFTQRFGRGSGAAPEKGITNAQYTVQADYFRDQNTTWDPNHKDNPFLYGYVGKFNQRFTPIYQFGQDTNTNGGVGYGFGTRLLGYGVDGVDFEAANYNPLLAQAASEYFRLSPNPSQFINGLVGGRNTFYNGGGPIAPYGLWTGVGSGQSGFSKSLVDQVALTADANFQILGKIKHSFEVGLYYQQRNERSYGVNGRGLWNLMRQLSQRVVNSNTADLNNPIFVIGGNRYTEQQFISSGLSLSPGDTIEYGQLVGTQGEFDRNVREMLGVSVNDYVQVDMLDPKNLSLDMFRADELLNAGQSLVNYAGYDYTGKLLNGQVNFNDFFTERDSRGNYTRPIGAFRPNYIAGYVSDYITFKDFSITLGVRAERFDLNTKVLKDPYSLYATAKADASTASANPNGSHPSNITDEYVPYVATNKGSSLTIVGYRNGDTWYDVNGREVSDPSTLGVGQAGASSVIEPYLQKGASDIKIDSSAFNPDNSFTDYTPQVNVMPRVNFSFPISEKGFLYAHYDVVVQRPVGGYGATPVDYLFWTTRAQAGTIGNANLKPEKLIDYEVGFQQQIGDRSAITLSAFYKERKDQIAIRQYFNAYPIEYSTYGNRDFSTTKGFTAFYDLRRSGPLSLELSYTLQFVEGTGSSEATRGGLLSNFTSSGNINLRPVFALDYDSRHIINLNLNYRYTDDADNRGPKVFGKYIFQNAGVNLVGRARSGEPYTRNAFNTSLVQTTSQRIEGQVAGARLPWHLMLDARIDKDFVVKFRKPKAGATAMGIRDRRSKGGLYFNVYCRITNVLNRRDVLSVNEYTGNPNDDGFLTSPLGEVYLSNINSSYGDGGVPAATNLYNIALANSAGVFNQPRRIWLGVQFNF